MGGPGAQVSKIRNHGTMTKEEWKEVVRIRLMVEEKDCTWSFPIKCPRWLFNLLSKLEL